MTGTQEQLLVVYCDTSYHEFANGGYAACAAYFKKLAVVVGSQYVSDAKEANLAAILVALEYIEKYVYRPSTVVVFTDSQYTIDQINSRSSLHFYQYTQEKTISDILLNLTQRKILVHFQKSEGTESLKATHNSPLDHDYAEYTTTAQLNPAKGLAYAHLLDKINKTTHNLEQYSQLVGDLDNISFVDTGIPTNPRVRMSMNIQTSARVSSRVTIPKATIENPPSRERVHALVSMFSNL